MDDDPDIRRALDRLLGVHGFAVKAYASGEAFIRDSDWNALSCVIADINLEGMSGIDLKRYMTTAGVALPFIFITAFDSLSTRQQAWDAGCVSYLSKPFRASVLIEAILSAAE